MFIRDPLVMGCIHKEVKFWGRGTAR